MSFSRLRLGWVFAAIIATGFSLGGCALTPGRVGYLVDSPQAKPLIASTAEGAVRGVQTPEGNVFLGLPFASPPVGPLRFRPPAPPQPWTGVRDATKAGDICEQIAIPGAGKQSEDCLTLNVYAPPGAPDPAHPRPVMVWIYGGGFSIGDNVQYDPSRIAARQGVIVVAPNYRLGPFGFMAHPALNSSGEGAYALQDQQAALHWVKTNIAQFGGDPANVTIFGESAGGWSVCYQLTAPGARGLFQRAIIESGACTSPHSALSMADAETGGAAMAADLGCGDPASADACLRALPAYAFRKAKAHRDGLLGKDSWSPAYGGDVLPQSPRAAIEAGDIAPVPVLNGTNRNEGRLFIYSDRLTGKLWSRKSYEQIVDDFFHADAPKVLAAYEAEAKDNYVIAYADIVTDSTFSCTAMTLNRLLAPHTRVYAYEFADPDAVFTLPRPPFVAPPLMAYHSSEIAYVFQTRWAVSDPAKFTPAQQRLSDDMQGYWASFARAGDPNGGGRPVWPVDAGQGPLRLAPTAVATAADFAAVHHCAFWNGLGY